ncbi:hypothetical protein F5Y05DRAFT_413346 [Hypoxylon sp. FL0543]|nr:hypothetical protein F5Y05DRAFT_413346 [Hypoxylon sp. FL0543]
MCASEAKDPSPEPHEEPKPPSRWTEIEDRILKQGVARYGVSHWDDVARLIWTRRSAEECRARWAELVPLLHDSLARRESRSEQQERRKRSMTASAPILKTTRHQEVAYLEPPPRAALEQRKQELREGPIKTTAPAQPITELSSSTPQVPLTMKPQLSSPGPAQAAAPALRSRRNTEPRVGAYQAVAGSGEEQKQREWLAPHPLMPGRFRTPSVSRQTSTSRNRNGTDKITPEKEF